MKMAVMKLVVALLCVTVLAPIVLYTDRLSTFSSSISNRGFNDDALDLVRETDFPVDSQQSSDSEVEKLRSIPEEPSDVVKEPIGVVYSDNLTNSDLVSSQSGDGSAALTGNESPLGRSGDYRSRVLSAAEEIAQSAGSALIKQVIGTGKDDHGLQKPRLVEENQKKKTEQTSGKADQGKHRSMAMDKQSSSMTKPDNRVRHLRDQLISAKVYLGLEATRSSPHFIKELRARMRDVQRALGVATVDSQLPKNVLDKMKAMEQTLADGKGIQDDCSAVVKKLRAMLHSAEEQLEVHRKQELFLMQLAAKTVPKGLHCLPLRLSSEYYSLDPSKQQFPNQEKLEDPKLYHYALFSDNILAVAVVVNSTVSHAKNPADHVFHIVTDRLNYAAMRMWFLSYQPGKAAVQVQNIEDLTWLNASYSPVIKQLGSRSMIDYYFKTHRANTDENLKYRNPKYLSILNHLRFYLPEIFPKLNKVVFLDDDIVVQKDLTGLWKINLKGKVNGAVETCGENFHRFDRYLNFSHPLIAQNFDPHACGWAYGMNIFDLVEWRKQKITDIYHSWQKLNQERVLWKLGTLPPGLITFWNRTFPLNRLWHVLGLGYNPHVSQKEIQRAAVIHYNGNMKPWLEIGIPKYRDYWAKYVDYNQLHLQGCNISP